MEQNAGIDDAAVMSVVEDRGPISTREVAETLGCSRRAAEYRLRTLYAEGSLESTAIGRELLWWAVE
ncbi:MAG: FaeA/PapI family transcriptional regulator [Halobacteriales archaeon]